MQSTQLDSVYQSDLAFRQTLNQERDKVITLQNRLDALRKQEGQPVLQMGVEKTFCEKGVQAQENTVEVLPVQQMIQQLEVTGPAFDIDQLKSIIVKYFVYEKRKY